MVKSLTHLLLLIMLYGMHTTGYAQMNFFHGHAVGWHWYEDPKEEIKADDDEDHQPSEDPETEMNAVRATIKQTLDQAILNPSKENIKNYITLQNQLMQQAQLFHHNWKTVLLEHPELNYSLIHPTNNLAKQVENDEQKIKTDEVIHALSKKIGIFFFYRSSCPYCKRFAPIVKEFAESYGLTLVPITTDGVSLPEFPNSYPDDGQAKQFSVTVEPALFAVNPYTDEAYPIAYGLTSQAEIKRNLLNIAAQFKEQSQ